MNIFIGNTYRYNETVIGVCKDPREDGIYMVGHETKDEIKRVKSFPPFDSVEEAQSVLDDYARAKGLPEVQG